MKGKTQIVFGLLCESRGYLIAVEVFEGNTSDSVTLELQIEKVKNRFAIQSMGARSLARVSRAGWHCNVVWVSDRGI